MFSLVFVCDRGYVQGEKTTEILFDAICLRLAHLFFIKCLYYRGPSVCGLLVPLRLVK